MLTLNTPYKDSSFGTLYGNWDETSFMLEFEELVIKKEDVNTYHCYGLLTAAQSLNNKMAIADPKKTKFLVKFTLHKTDWTYKQKKDNEWVEKTIKATNFEQFFIFTIEQNESLYLSTDKAMSGVINVSSTQIMKDVWSHIEKVGKLEFPKDIEPFLRSYPLLSFTFGPINDLNPFMSEIGQSTTTKNNGYNKGKYDVDRLKKFKELYAEYTDTPLANVSIFGIRAELLSWLVEDKETYDVLMDLARIIVR